MLEIWGVSEGSVCMEEIGQKNLVLSYSDPNFINSCLGDLMCQIYCPCHVLQRFNCEWSSYTANWQKCESLPRFMLNASSILNFTTCPAGGRTYSWCAPSVSHYGITMTYVAFSGRGQSVFSWKTSQERHENVYICDHFGDVSCDVFPQEYGLTTLPNAPIAALWCLWTFRLRSLRWAWIMRWCLPNGGHLCLCMKEIRKFLHVCWHHLLLHLFKCAVWVSFMSCFIN